MAFDWYPVIEKLGMVGILLLVNHQYKVKLDKLELRQDKHNEAVELKYNGVHKLYIAALEKIASLETTLRMLQNRNIENQSYSSDTGLSEGQKVLPPPTPCGLDC